MQLHAFSRHNQTVHAAFFGSDTISVLSTTSFAGIIVFCSYILAVLIPNLAVCVRRLHDIGKSGWYFLVILIPSLGQVILFIWFCTNSEVGANKWGDNPKEK